MTLNSKQQSEMKIIISDSLDDAENNWKKIGHLLKSSMSIESIAESIEMPSLIPDHPIVKDGIPIVKPFIALVIDMRNSTEHMHSVLKTAAISEFERVYHETSALLPALATAIAFENGSVTEFLGDGVIGLFGVSDTPSAEVKAAFRAADNCVNIVRDLINIELRDRYNLPPIDLGAGLAYGKAMVTLVGSRSNKQPKVLGKCVYEASKLSGGVNAVVVSEALRGMWPKAKGGNLRFLKKNIRGVDGFKVNWK